MWDATEKRGWGKTYGLANLWKPPYTIFIIFLNKGYLEGEWFKRSTSD